ncbi:response regulator [Shimazuella sp. AN120528]|uniref:response regulator n=1 Tax=Shimazuella soli TaxID=1892854 RepID=UPI001F0D9752|nr:response regulator [Shimazuella soli]MCH5583395.1 response regulator [Shimazuella soli]
MSQKNIQVVVVDDDFMIARLHGKLVDSIPCYQLAGTANNYETALHLVNELQPDLLLLDVYMPDRSGMELVRTIRAKTLPCDVILITAAKELEVIEEGFRFGVFDYLIKPFDLDRLQKTLKKYFQYKMSLAKSNTLSIDQTVVDDLKQLRSVNQSVNQLQQKGIDLRTLERVRNCLLQANRFLSAEEVASMSGVSRSTARNYLVHLVESQRAEEQLLYGTVGRPQRLYRCKD